MAHSSECAKDIVKRSRIANSSGAASSRERRQSQQEAKTRHKEQD
jgi:hypothetical protein